MSLFSIETLYFLSLGVIGFLILLLIFHFRNKIVQLEKQVQDFHSVATELIQEMKQMETNNNNHGFTKQMKCCNGGCCPCIKKENLLENFIINKCFRDEEEEEDEDEDDYDEDDAETVNLQEKTICLGETIKMDEESIHNFIDLGEDPFIEEKHISIEEGTPAVTPIEKAEEEDTSIDLKFIDANQNLRAQLEIAQNSAQTPVAEEENHEEDTYAGENNYKKMSVHQLRTLATERGITVIHLKMKKNELIQLLLESEKPIN
jgi:hypothetical protein